MSGFILVSFAMLIVFAVLLHQVVTNLIYVASTNEALVFAGAGSKYEVVKGGRRLRVPLLETVHRMDLTLISIDVAVKSAFSKGGIPLDVAGVANVKIAGQSPELDCAIQRFLGLSRKNIENVAKDTLEGALRGIVAKMTPVELNENKVKFERELEAEARETLSLLGLTLDNLKIQAVSDRVSYLSAIGEREKAVLFQRARIAEAKNRGEAAIKSAENRRVAEIARLNAEISKFRAESQRRVTNAVTARAAMVAEEEGKVRAAVALAKADVQVQKARIEQVRLKLQADMIEPAQAQMKASIREARGSAAVIAEEGRAIAEGLKSLVTQWQKAGPAAREIILLQKIDKILTTLLSSVDGVQINRVALFGNNNTQSRGGPNSESQLSKSLLKTLEELKSGTGLDLAESLAKLTGQSSRDNKMPAKAKANKAADQQMKRAKAALAKAQKRHQAEMATAPQPRSAAAVASKQPASAIEPEAAKPKLSIHRRSAKKKDPSRS